MWRVWVWAWGVEMGYCGMVFMVYMILDTYCRVELGKGNE